MLLGSLVASGVVIAALARWRSLSMWLMLALSIAVLAAGIAGLNEVGTAWLHQPYLALSPLRSWFLLILGIVASMSSWFRLGYHQHHHVSTAFWLPIFLVSMVTVITAQTVWIFMTAWEGMAISSFFLVATYHERPGVIKSAYIYLVMSQLSAMLILSGFLLMGTQLHSLDFAVWALRAQYLPGSAKNAIFALLFLGFAIKSGVVPFHVWLPRAHPVAPAHVSSLMSGAMIKLGIFGIVQFLLVDMGATATFWALLLLASGAVSSVLGVLYALMEHDLKRLLAYHSIENIGIILLGLGVMALGMDWHRPELFTIGLVAALFHTLNHAVFKSQLFLAAGAVEQHTGTLDMERLGGLIRTMPVIAVSFILGSMAISALPPFNGFISEWLTFRGLLAVAGHSTIFWGLTALGASLLLALTGALAALCFVKVSGIVFLGQPREQRAYAGIPWSLTAPVLGLAAASLLLGIFPEPIVRIIATLEPQSSAVSVTHLLPTNVTALALGLLLIAALAAIFARVWKVREVPRWACGGEAEPAMQMSSASFTKAVRTTFSVIYRPHRQLVRQGTYSRDFPERLAYRGGTTPIWDRFVYRPVYRLAWTLSHFSTRIQAGPVRLYLTYVLVTVGIMLLLIR
jgi:hydrogenase-4 component B